MHWPLTNNIRVVLVFFFFPFAAVAALEQPWRGEERRRKRFQCNVSPARLGMSVSKAYRVASRVGHLDINEGKLGMIEVALVILWTLSTFT